MDYPNTPWGTLQRLKDVQAGAALSDEQAAAQAEDEPSTATLTKKKKAKKKTS